MRLVDRFSHPVAGINNLATGLGDWSTWWNIGF